MSKELTISQKEIESRIFVFRDSQVMLDRDLAEMYQVETKVLNQAVKRNIERFPKQFRFQLTDNEKMELVTNCDRFESLKHSSTNPFAFTEQGVAMLSAVLRSDVAVKVSIQIINAFVEMRKLIANHSGLLQRMDGIERKQLETDQKFEKVFKALESKDLIPAQGVFFDGQVFDAYELVSKIIRSAKKNIVLIDNYIDESALTHLSKKTKVVKVLLLTKTISKQLTLDVKKANEQYSNFELKIFTKSHDRFLIIDNTEVYHLGASLKDLGKKWFAFSKLDKNSIANILKEIGV
ncbi:ORF6N domain-containing protein [Belliella kenyensis]|uniref:ORF6N domain-containing protein n=1 Tax=Belliella kenyensis TaxID=1472724 RepID=A0ABV8EJU8_9BACT|nr:ORF6N domain-containing protein [Belliella kenyensis]MCH7403193.1 ORF6N domain-containing protein [Belliella kenyensis]MDN3604804.1 ORF6N domain-containing protein [Belliella kenyensis]